MLSYMWGCKTTCARCQYDDFDILASFLTSWHLFHVSFRQIFRLQSIREEPNPTSLDKKKCSYFSIKLIKQHVCKFKPKCNSWKKSMQEKESVMVVRFKLKIPSLGITVRHHTASLLMSNSYPCDGIFNPNLTIIKDSYILHCINLVASRQNQQKDCVPCKDSDQPGHLPSLIRAFTVRSVGS